MKPANKGQVFGSDNVYLDFFFIHQFINFFLLKFVSVNFFKIVASEIHSSILTLNNKGYYRRKIAEKG